MGSLERAFKQIARERGQRGEERVGTALEELFQKGKNPRWLTGYRRSSREEDLRRGFDWVVETDVGKIPIQVKSSIKAKEKFQKNHSRIPVVICKSGEGVESLQGKVIDAIAGKRQSLLEERKSVY